MFQFVPQKLQITQSKSMRMCQNLNIIFLVHGGDGVHGVHGGEKNVEDFRIKRQEQWQDLLPIDVSGQIQQAFE